MNERVFGEQQMMAIVGSEYSPLWMMIMVVAILLSSAVVVASELTHSVALGSSRDIWMNSKDADGYHHLQESQTLMRVTHFLWLRSVSNFERLLIFIL